MDKELRFLIDAFRVGFGAARRAPAASGVREIEGQPPIDVFDPSDRWRHGTSHPNRVDTSFYRWVWFRADIELAEGATEG